MVKKNVPANSTQAILFLVLICFFLSGLSSLIYQVLWTKMIVKIIGSAPFAVAIVLTIFMGGLGLGSFLAARIIDSVKDPARLVRIYGLLELAVGAYALVIPLLLKIFRPLYAVLYNHLYDRFLLYNFLTFIGCSIILCFPVICMGGHFARTLPVLCDAPLASGDPRRQVVRIEYHRCRIRCAIVWFLAYKLSGDFGYFDSCRSYKYFYWLGLFDCRRTNTN